MTNNTLNGSLTALGELMATNLTTMGVTSQANEGLTTLANKILLIEGSVGGITISTNLTIQASANSILVNNPVTITGKLNASFDDTTQTNDDLVGYIQHANVEIYNGNTLLDTVTTDNAGEYTYTYTPTTGGTLSIKAVYDGGEYYEDCYSSTVSVTVIDKSLTLTSSKDILSYADSDSAILTATYKEEGVGVSGKTVFFDGVYETTPNSRTISTTKTKVGSKYTITSLPTDSTTVHLDKSTYGITIQYMTGTAGNAYSLILWEDSRPSSPYRCPSGDFSVDNGTLTFTDENSQVQTLDISMYDCSEIYTVAGAGASAGSVTIDDYGVFRTTDSNGQATYTYNSQGVGDLTVTAECMNLQETYVLTDAILVDAMTTYKTDRWTGSTSGLTYNSDGVTANSSNWTRRYITKSIPSNVSIKYTITYLQSSDSLYFPLLNANAPTSSTSGDFVDFNYKSTGITVGSTTTNVTSALGTWEIRINNGTITVYLDGNQVYTTSSVTIPSNITFGFTAGGGSSKKFTFKDVIVKAL